MNLEKAIMLSFFAAMGGGFIVFPGILLRSDAIYFAGMSWVGVCAFVMFCLIVYDVLISD